MTKLVTETSKERTSTIPGHHTAAKWRLKDSRGTRPQNLRNHGGGQGTDILSAEQGLPVNAWFPAEGLKVSRLGS